METGCFDYGGDLRVAQEGSIPSSCRVRLHDSAVTRTSGGRYIARCVDREVSSKRTAKRRRRVTLCAVCALLNGLLAASSLVLFAAEAGPPDGESRVLAVLPPVLLLTFVILLVACLVMYLDLGDGRDEGPDDEDGPGGGGEGDDRDPLSGGGLDVDWERFEAEFRAYVQRLRVPA